MSDEETDTKIKNFNSKVLQIGIETTLRGIKAIEDEVFILNEALNEKDEELQRTNELVKQQNEIIENLKSSMEPSFFDDLDDPDVFDAPPSEKIVKDLKKEIKKKDAIIRRYEDEVKALKLKMKEQNVVLQAWVDNFDAWS
eukprot:TRINITY_DN8651_c0_g1_i1.p1 TRINITY_DN8651_c0_g1~~TRINITY_DN8651_c0_g1_i1.p1  ORF type:complete len:141 (-),score=41.69 TRINITY_DN8651_c0_g1_i1:55-477(-)